MSSPRTHTRSAHPDAATLAAFTDGRLARTEHAQVVQHLADCSDCFELVADSAEILEELDEEAASSERGAAPDTSSTLPGGAFDPGPAPDTVPDNVVVHPRSWRRWAPAAASLAAAVALVLVGIWQLGWLTGPDLAVTRLAKQLEDTASQLNQDDWDDFGVPSFLGQEHPTEEMKDSFAAGVHAVDLQVALSTGHQERAHAAGALLRNTLESLPGTALALLPAYDERVFEPLQAHKALPPIEAAAGELAMRLAGPLLSELHFDFGKWTEAGRLAALGGDTDMLQSHDFRGALDDFVEAGLAEDVTARLLEIRERLDGELDPEALSLLVDDFRSIQAGRGLSVRDLS